MQYTRLIKKAGQDLINGRGDLKQIYLKYYITGYTKLYILRITKRVVCFDMRILMMKMKILLQIKTKNDSQTRKLELKKVYRKLFGKLNKALDKELHR